MTADMALVDFVPSSDPLLRAPSLAHTTVLPVLGITTRFETNSAYVLGVATEAFGVWRALGTSVDGPRGAPEVRVRVVVHEGTEHVAGRAPVRHVCPDGARILVQSPGSVAVADPERGESVAYVTTTLAADRPHFRAAVLEAITLALLAHRDRHPIHAAGVARGGRAVLLAGPSGSGKSTLAYLAHSSGLDVLGDDRVWVQREPALRVWGWPGQARLTADTVRHFPEVATVGTTSVVGGKEKLAVELGVTRALDAARHAVVCLLARGPRVALERLPRDAIVDALRHGVDPGFDRFPARHEAVARDLAGDGGWRLTLSDDPHDALPLLKAMLGA